MTEPQMREAFEAWAKRRGLGVGRYHPLQRAGDYVSIETTVRWEAWQAALLAIQPEIDRLREALEPFKSAHDIAEGNTWRDNHDWLHMARTELDQEDFVRAAQVYGEKS